MLLPAVLLALLLLLLPALLAQPLHLLLEPQLPSMQLSSITALQQHKQLLMPHHTVATPQRASAAAAALSWLQEP
jgi:hypothetical protein